MFLFLLPLSFSLLYSLFSLSLLPLSILMFLNYTSFTLLRDSVYNQHTYLSWVNILCQCLVQLQLMVVNIIREALFTGCAVARQHNSIYDTLGHSGSCVHIVVGKQNLLLSGRVGVNQGYLAITAGHRFVDAVVRLTCCRSRNHSRQSESCYGTSRFLSNILLFSISFVCWL